MTTTVLTGDVCVTEFAEIDSTGAEFVEISSHTAVRHKRKLVL
jgi:hypothetical protein